MDCRNALEKLEVVRPGSDDLADPELAEAKAYLDSSDACQTVFRKRQALDREIGRGMRAVPVPSELKGRLLAALDLADTATNDHAGSETGIATETPEQTQPSEETAAPNRRRRVLQFSSAAAACLIAGIAIWLLRPADVSTITMADLRESIPLQLRGLGEPPDLPAIENGKGVSRQLFGITEPPRGFQPEGFGNKVAAVFAFRVVTGRQRPAINGILLVIPEEFVTDSPGASSFNGGSTIYLKSGAHATVAWKSGGYVYMCVVPVKDLDRLREALHPQFA